MTDSTDSFARADGELVSPPSEREGLRSTASRRAGRLLGAAAVLSTTALLPIIEPKAPPFKGD